MKKLNMAFAVRTQVVLLFAICFGINTIRAQTTVSIGGGASVTCPALPTATYTPAVSGVTFSNWSRGSGVTCNTSTTALNGNGFNTASFSASFTANKYYSLTITAGSSTPFLLTQIVWNTTVSSGSAKLTMEYSNNGGAVTTFGSTDQLISGTGSVTFNGSVSVAAGTSIVLYFVPQGTGANTTTVRLSNGSTVTINTGTPASTDWFRSAQSGNWSSFTSWESSTDGATWFAATQTPTSTAHSIQIQNLHVINITSPQSAKLLVVDAGGVLVHAAGFGLTVTDDGTSAADFIINGRYELNGTMPTYNVGTEKVVVNNNAEVRANDNTPPNSASDDFARDIHVYFNTGSLFSWYYGGVSTFSTSGSTYFPNATASDKAIFRVCSNIGGTVGGGSSTTFNCKFEIASGIITNIQNAGIKTFRDGLGGAGTLIHSSTCGPFRITSATAVIDGSLTVDIENSTVAGDDFEIPTGANVTMSGIATVNIGKFPNTTASLKVDGTLVTNGRLVFKSDVNGTGRHSTSTGTISGNAIIERYIPAKRAWRLLTHSLKAGSTQTINAAWQEGATPNPSVVTLNNPRPFYGTQITKNRNLDIATGYDANLQANPSIYSLDNATTAVIGSTYTPITDFRSYFIFVRGNRANQINLQTTAPTSTTTLRTTGEINIGTITYPIGVAAGQYFGIGNPYVSSIELDSVFIRSYVSGVDTSTFAIWDPKLAPYGGYLTYLNGASNASPLSNYTTTASLFKIQCGQAFILKARTANPIVSFIEGDKVATASSTFFARQSPPAIKVQLHGDSAELLDIVTVGFADKATAPKFGKTGEELALVRNSVRHSIEIRPLESTDTFFIEFAKLTRKPYELEISSELLGLKADVLLRDNFLQRDTLLTEALLKYPFTVTTDTFSFKRRFQIVLKKIAEDTIPVIRNDKFSVYPNPVRDGDILTINGLHDPRTIVRIISMQGVEVLRSTIPSKTINCSFLARGTYVVIAGHMVTRFTKL